MLKKLPLYPLFLSIFSVIFLAAYNVGQIPISAIFRPLIAYILFGLAIHGLTQLFLTDWHRSALVTAILLSMFAAYGQIYVLIKGQMGARASVFDHNTFLPWYVLVFAIVLFLVIYRIKDASTYTLWLNFILLSLLIHPTFSILVAVYQQWVIDHPTEKYSGPTAVNTGQPDIYYIILDAYGREDVLLNELGYDNSEFLNSLRQRGFYIADCSQSNYAYTGYSLASSLNYDYLDQLKAATEFERAQLLKHSKIRLFLEANDYKVVAFPTGWVFTEWQDADLYLDYPHSWRTLTEYETFLINTTMLRALNDVDLFNQVNSSLTSPRRLRALSLLSNLGQLPQNDEKLFIYAHLMLPHPPYSFNADGNPSNFKEENVSHQDVIDAYIGQVKFVNHEILTIIDSILSQAKEPPVIILQGDHGPAPELSLTYAEKMPILNAYFLPGKQTDRLMYPSVSPVNSFRIVLNSYFGENLPLLEDKSYYAPPENPDAYTLVPNSCPEQQ